MKLRSLVAVLATATVLPVLAAASPASARDDVVLVFPEATQVNPVTTPYVIHVESGDTTGLKVAVNNGTKIGVDEAGDLVPVFVTQGYQVVTVSRCSSQQGCATIESRQIEAYSEVVRGPVAKIFAGPQNQARVHVNIAPYPAAATLDWSVVVPATDAIVASGTQELETGPGRLVGPIDVPADTASGTYRLRWHVTADSETYGHLDSDLDPATFVWDADADPGSVRLSSPVVYPERDGYLDRVNIDPSYPKGVTADIEVLDRSGTPIGLLGPEQPGRPIVWKPKPDLAPGTYRVRITTTDAADNVATRDKPIAVKSGHLAWKTWRKRLTASSTLIDSTVGSCSTLSRHPRSRPKGALGLYSQTKCSREDDSLVITLNAVDLPASLAGFRDLRIAATGGKAAGAPDAYAVLYYYDVRKKKYVHRVDLPGRDATTRGPLARKAATYISTEGGTPHVFWTLGLTAGSRFDVESYTVEVGYQALVGR